MVDVDFLVKIPIFSTLNGDDLQTLKKLWKPLTKEAGQLVFKKGDPGKAMYLVRDGEISISVWTSQNQEEVLSILGEGDFFGELALFDGLARTANAKALKKTILLEMTREDFLDFLRTRHDVTITMMTVIAERLRKTNEAMERSATRNVNQEIEFQMHFGDRLSDRLANIIGSWGFIISFFIFLGSWVSLNTIQIFFRPLDPFPFTFLNLMLSSIAAFQAPVIMMSQNRQAQKDRLSAELDYQVNMKAEMQIQSLHVKMDELRASEIHELLEFQREQIAILKKQLELAQHPTV